MNGNMITNVIASVFAVALVTTLVLPQRKTPEVLTAAGGALSDVTRASLGMH